jgi:hypothetical protein
MPERFKLPEQRPRPSADDCPELDLGEVYREVTGGTWHEPSHDPRLVENAYQKSFETKSEKIRAKLDEIAADREEMQADAERKEQRNKAKDAASSGQTAVARTAELRVA